MGSGIDLNRNVFSVYNSLSCVQTYFTADSFISRLYSDPYVGPFSGMDPVLSSDLYFGPYSCPYSDLLNDVYLGLYSGPDMKL